MAKNAATKKFSYTYGGTPRDATISNVSGKDVISYTQDGYTYAIDAASSSLNIKYASGAYYSGPYTPDDIKDWLTWGATRDEYKAVLEGFENYKQQQTPRPEVVAAAEVAAPISTSVNFIPGRSQFRGMSAYHPSIFLTSANAV